MALIVIRAEEKGFLRENGASPFSLKRVSSPCFFAQAKKHGRRMSARRRHAASNRRKAAALSESQAATK
jgi:hypothetical protein